MLGFYKVTTYRERERERERENSKFSVPLTYMYMYIHGVQLNEPYFAQLLVLMIYKSSTNGIKEKVLKATN